MTRALVVALVALASSLARADDVSVDVDRATLDAGLATLVDRFDEPVGLAVPANLPKLGLRKGDVVRAVDGHVVFRDGLSVSYSARVVFLDVTRGGRRVVVRIGVYPAARDARVQRARLRIALADSPPFAQATRNGKPTGVVLRGELASADALRVGDIIRKIDGVATPTVADVIAALEKAIDQPQIAFAIDRMDKSIGVTIDLYEPISDELLGQIVKIDDTTYDVPARVVDALRGDPVAVAETVRVVPMTKDGKPAGLKLYAIRPRSILAVLGFTNGDAVEAVDGVPLVSVDPLPAIAAKLRAGQRVEVSISRRGKPMTFVYNIK